MTSRESLEKTTHTWDGSNPGQLQKGISKGDTELCGKTLVTHKAATAEKQQVRWRTRTHGKQS